MNFKEYVESKAIKLPWSGCHIWEGAITRGGYARSMRAQREQGTTIVHRALFSFLNGCVPIGFYVCHECDTPGCVNPNHLFLGTPTDNAQDRAIKGRNAPRHGERNGRSKLRNSDIAEIKDLLCSTGLKQSEIGEIFGVSQSAISGINSKRTWRLL